jgi:methanogenic corrinoid protein MtbC1
VSDVGETSWGSWTLRRADADLDTVVAEATAVLPQQVRDPLAEMAGDYYQSLDAALAYDAPALLAEHFARYRERLAQLSPGVDRALLLRNLCDVLGRHVDPETRVLVNTLVGQTVLIAGQRPPQPAERLPDAQARGLTTRLLEAVDEGRHDHARTEVVRALEDGCAPQVLLEEVLLPFHDTLLARQEEAPLQRAESERLQELVRTLLFSVVPPDLSFPMVTRRVLLTEARLPAGWRAGLPRMVFECAGWHVDTVDADACAETVAKAAHAHESQVVVVHAARAADLDLARERIAAVHEAAPAARVLAQGRPFRAVPALAARLGADAGCGGLGAAVQAAAALLED